MSTRQIAIVVHSGGGTTALMADAVARGVQSVGGCIAEVHRIAPEQIVEGRFKDDAMLQALDGADAIVFGCPTYMGGPSAQLKAFLDATIDRWYRRAWKDKLAAGFTVSSSPIGDKTNTLQSLVVFAMQMGMLWIGHADVPMDPSGGNRLSAFLGAAGQADYSAAEQPAIVEADAVAGEHLGARVAALAHRFQDEGA